MARGPKSDKFWSDAVRLAAFRQCETDPERRKYINLIAENLVASAMEGNMDAIKEIGDRIDGRPKQAVEHSEDQDAPLGGAAVERLTQLLNRLGSSQPG